MTLLLFLLNVFAVNGMKDFWNATLRDKSDELISDFRANIEGVTFSGVFTNNTILQREPQIASVYGLADKPNTKITLTISGDDASGNSYNNVLSTTSDNNGDWKILMDAAMKSGGNYTFNVQCSECNNPSIEDTLYNVTFGDVYYCSGQSNMELSMHYTFARNDTYSSITKLNKYSNLRFFTMWEIDTSTQTFVVPHKYGNVENKWNFVDNTTVLDRFTAVCWYFGQSLYDIYNITTVPIGLIDVSIGGTMIEQWIKNETVQLYCKDSLCPDMKCGGLYNGMVSTFVNMTIKSILWWQGENNMHEIPGNWYNFTGYGCMQPFMLRQWRNIFSVTPNTTPSNVPFGLVTLAAGTDEGASYNMGAFRWAQTANFDYLPNTEMTNTFVALGHDMGEPWGQGCGNQNPPICKQSGSPYSFADTPQFMGPIHPRIKLPIGQRLAYAGYNLLYGDDVKKDNVVVVSGPVISGCNLDMNKKQIIIKFNDTYLNGEKVQIIPWSAWYNKSLTVDNWSSMQIGYEKQWQFTNISLSVDGSNNVIVDVTEFVNKNVTITGLRYAYETFPCCGNLNKNMYPCPPNNCPIKSFIPNTNISLPAAPFWAKIVNETCVCFAPQIC